MLTRWRLPPGQTPDLLAGALLQAGLLEHRRDRRPRVGDALQAGEQPQVLGHRELRVERGLLWHPADAGRAARLTLPALGRCAPASIDSSVVLPAPLGPITATISPARASKLTSRSATRSP